ncbi:hypothetical protein [Parablautia muri]|uniref:Lipoprotein n=1 Tax=Parablautia muri TaxID=2320879 RepID=A0A9X5BJ27_9FIRM|nr:hypothetical protein [Parablautia muri]NBJ94671.1 hypothetical protein [Parablautia muri]
MKKKILLLTLFSLLLSGCSKEVVTVAGIQSEDGQDADYIEMKEFELKSQKTETNKEGVSCCAVLIPSGYQESDEIPGMYVHEKSPLDSSNVYYTISEGSGDGRVSEALTKDSYEEILEEAFQEAGQDIDLEIEAFEEIDMEGIPAYKIRSSYRVEDGEIEQLTYLILAENTYTITYSQMSDDELMADFEISDGAIRLVREEEVSLAKDK